MVPPSRPFILLAFLAALFTAPLLADVAPEPQYGQTLAPRKETSVRMVEETVTIRLEKQKALVHALFVMENKGGAVKHEVGFPDVVTPASWGSHKPPEGVSSYMLNNLEVKVDGEAVETTYHYVKGAESPSLLQEIEEQKRQIAQAKDPAEKERFEGYLRQLERRLNRWAYRGWSVWEMEFPSGSTREIDVTYWLPYRPPYRPSLLREGFMEYILRTGAAWKGTIGKATIHLKLEDGLTRDNVASLKPPGFRWSDDEATLELKDFEPDQDVEIALKQFVNFEQAARHALDQADKLAGSKPDDSAYRLVSAAQGFEKAGLWEECVGVCRRIIAHEKAAREGDPKRTGRYIVQGWRQPYFPWECTIFSCAKKLGDAERIKEAAKDAARAIETLLADESSRRPAIDEEKLREILEECGKAK